MQHFQEFSFPRDFFQPETLKTKKILEQIKRDLKMLNFMYSFHVLGFLHFTIFRSEGQILLVDIHFVQIGLIRIF